MHILLKTEQPSICADRRPNRAPCGVSGGGDPFGATASWSIGSRFRGERTSFSAFGRRATSGVEPTWLDP